MSDTRDAPVCFVLMPFGSKLDPAGGPDIDFDAIYDNAIRPAIEEVGLLPVRADEERTGGVIHKPMFERLLLADFAVADLTTSNANVFYELGVRHATRPRTTLPIFATGRSVPFDVNLVRALPYSLAQGNVFGPKEADALRTALADRLRALIRVGHEDDAPDSPLFQLLDGYDPPPLARLKTDVFRDQVRYTEGQKTRLADARSQGAEGLPLLDALRDELPMESAELGVLVDLFLSYRALSAWESMIELYEQFPEALKRAVLIREQLGFALNRAERRGDAVAVLEGVIREHGPSSETCGILGRVHKDRWTDATRDGQSARARGHLRQAIDTYCRGFEADWRDAYPGINAVTLLEIQGGQAARERQAKLLPVVRFSVERRLNDAAPDYWDHATLLELAALASDWDDADEHLGDALASAQEGWQLGTTANNLRLIREARKSRGETVDRLEELEAALADEQKRLE